MKRLAVWLILILSFMGLADSAYLAEHESNGDPLLCTVNGLSNCNLVAQSPYSHLFSLPIADYGVAFFAILFSLAALELFLPHTYVRRVLQVFVALGVVASAYFVFIQFSVIDAFCIYCVISAGISFLVFILGYFIEPLSGTMALPMPPPRSHSSLVLPPPHS